MDELTKNKTNDRKDRDIDIGRLLHRIRARLIPICIVTLLVGLIAYYVNAHVFTPQYVSTTKIYVLARSNDGDDTVTTGELQAGELLTKDYEDIIKSRNVIERVIDRLGLEDADGSPQSYEHVLSSVEVATKSGRRILEINVTDPDPRQAQRIANAVRDVSAEQIQKIMDTKTVKTVDEANLPTIPASPAVFSNTIKCTLVGFLVSVFSVFLSGLFDDGIRTEEDVERYLHVSTLGEIPRAGNRKELKLSQLSEAVVADNVVKLRVPEHDYRMEEAYRTLRTNLQFCGVDKKVIAVTSCVPDEGKTTVALQTAISLAQIGKRTVFVDADMRKSVLIERLILTEKKQKGLSDLLSGQQSLNNVLLSTELKQLKLITSGFFPPNPAELLSSVYFEKLVSILRETADYVIIDTPPLGTVIDSAIIAKECDGAILVLESGNINYRFAQDVIHQLERSESPLLGVVINKVDISKRNGRYYGKYYGRYSKRYYGRYYGYGNYGAHTSASRSGKIKRDS